MYSHNIRDDAGVAKEKKRKKEKEKKGKKKKKEKKGKRGTIQFFVFFNQIL